MPPALCQIALSTRDLDVSLRWYQEVFGFLPAGRREGGGERIARLQGLPESEFEIAWLVDRQTYFQLELFRFTKPEPRPRPATRNQRDIGYTTIGIHVDAFDEALARLAVCGSPTLTGPVGPPGSRRVCASDPNGILVELMEDDPRQPGVERRTRPDVPSVIRSVTASVPDLERSRRFWVDGVGLIETPQTQLHGPEHEALWGLDGSERETLVLWGSDVLLELVEYVAPRGNDWPAGYRISDVGIVNVAVGGPDLTVYEQTARRTREAGYRQHVEGEFSGARAVYVDDDQGFSLELLYRSAETAHLAGFEPL